MPRRASQERVKTERSCETNLVGDRDVVVDDDEDFDGEKNKKKSSRRQSISPSKPHRRKAEAQAPTSPSSRKRKATAVISGPSTNDDEIENTGKTIDSDGADTTSVPVTERPKKRKRKTYKVNEKEEALPTSARKTERGGYAHKSSSKAKISMANAGNTPWNIGKERSSADRAKIAAGVRARNRGVLLEKLKQLGMTEEEYLKKKKEVKYIRERVRRAKISNAKHQQRELQAALDAKLEDLEGHKQQEEQERAEESKEAQKTKAEAVMAERAKKLFQRDIHWTPFSFSGNEQDDSYDQVCPTGGPGGLICCETCSRMYQAYLTRSVQDIEVQRMQKGAAELKEILGFVAEDTEALAAAVEAASNRIPPLPPPVPKKRVITSTASRTSSRKGTTEREMEVGDFNLTSTIDVGAAGCSGLIHQV